MIDWPEEHADEFADWAERRVSSAMAGIGTHAYVEVNVTGGA
jgi:hypothetical protein